MTCSYARSLLESYLDRELPANNRFSLEKHLEACTSCRAEYKELTRLKGLLSQSACPEPYKEYWGEVRDLILARTAEADAVVDIQAEVTRRAKEQSSFYRSIIALAASLTIFVTSLLLGSSGPVGTPHQSRQSVPNEAGSSYVTAISSAASTISPDERALLTGGMLLVGTPGMFASPVDMAVILGLDGIH